MAFSPDGKQAVSCSGDRKVQLWDTVIRETLEGHSSTIMSVAFSQNGKQVVSGSWDKTIRIWDDVTGAVVQTLEGHLSTVKSVAFSSDGQAEHTLFVSDDWVVEGATYILWLPPDYRPTCQAVWNKLTILGHSPGRISMLEFEEKSRLI